MYLYFILIVFSLLISIFSISSYYIYVRLGELCENCIDCLFDIIYNAYQIYTS